ncbi:hypothetical protein [Falsihalocynthiibacter arcticus]|uniref:hypothetical protein n=1 Tax=Falsihalocynthiibacter arcticus TaxID=1579316 RepID=UPI0012E95C17|nr:hypothetical protein [Falsihalocynthiibacter arcticus]
MIISCLLEIKTWISEAARGPGNMRHVLLRNGEVVGSSASLREDRAIAVAGL